MVRSYFLVFMLVVAAVTAVERKHAANHHDNSDHHHHHGHKHHGDHKSGQALEQSPRQEEIADYKALDEPIQKVTENKDASVLKATATRQEAQDEDTELNQKVRIFACDYNTSPRYSCFDCRTRMLCKYQNVGKLINCNYALKPYCNNGICSATPAAGCA